MKNTFLKNANTYLKKSLITKYFLKSDSSAKSKRHNFKKYSNLRCQIHLFDDREIDFCYDIESISSLIAAETIQDHYSNIALYEMKKDQKIRCKDINNRQKSNI